MPGLRGPPDSGGEGAVVSTVERVLHSLGALASVEGDGVGSGPGHVGRVLFDGGLAQMEVCQHEIVVAMVKSALKEVSGGSSQGGDTGSKAVYHCHAEGSGMASQDGNSS